MKSKLLPLALATVILSSFISLSAFNGHALLDDPYATKYVTPSSDTIPKLKERFGDHLLDKKTNPFDLSDPKIINKEVEFDPATGNYIIYERIGDDYFRPPTYMTFEEYLAYRQAEEEKEYFKNLSGVAAGKDGVSALDPVAKFDVDKSLIDRLFGGNTVDIRPQGGIDLTFGYNWSRTLNPISPRGGRGFGSPNFDMDINMSVTGKIGEKLNLNTQYNTNATFNFDNQIKLAFDSDQFNEDDIIKKIEAGNVSLPLRGQLIQGAESLFGLKTELQFGHLRLTAIAAQQNSERENILLEGGATLQEFEVKADEYDENRHFFISHYNRANFEPALDSLPIIQSLFTLENIEVWVTNDRNEVDDVRDIIALADLGEPQELVNPENVERFPDPIFREICNGLPLPDNRANRLYQEILNRGDRIRSIDQAVAILQSSEFGLVQTRDFEKMSARKLRASEYTIHPQLGFISLNINLRPDQVLAVGYNYTYNSNTFSVGELAFNVDNVNADTTAPVPEVLFVKMLKSTTQRTDIPTWDLMMKNVYSIGGFRLSQEDFELDIYYEDPGRGNKRFLPESNLANFPFLRLFNLDNLNSQRDPQPDGRFDFVPGLTILPENGRIIFPVLEPFGSFLSERITDPRFREEYTYQELYDQTVFQAQEFPEKNRYVIKGEFKSSTSSDISLGAFNIPRGSVRVTAGRELVEGIDYEIDYAIGRLRILNDAILNSKVPINVSYEDNSLFGFQNKTMLGLRADYEIDDNFQIGGTFLQLFERPFTQKVNIGEDPINNKMYGLDMNYSREAPWLTKIVDGIPGIQTNAASNISFTAEAAALKPGHSRAINQARGDRDGLVYIDDFEGSSNSLALGNGAIQWKLASVPQNDNENNNPLFPESALINDIRGGANRANLSWYNIIDRNAGQNFGNRDREADAGNVYSSLVTQQEVFPNRQTVQTLAANIQTFDLIYCPDERGQYNFDIPNGYPGISAGVSLDGENNVKLEEPETRWAGVMRQMRNADFQAANVEFLEFWLLSPYLDPNSPDQPSETRDGQQGELYFNFGNISEDILRDSRKSFENGLPSSQNTRVKTSQTNWSRIAISRELNNSFAAQEATREEQDLGLDGLDDAGERVQFADYLNAFGDPIARSILSQDPSNDNYVAPWDNSQPFETNALLRYSKYNGTEGNSQGNFQTSGLGERPNAATNNSDSEDINGDQTMNESESYFQYKVPVFYDPMNPRRIDRTRTPYITDERDAANGRIWYRFRVPLRGNDKIAVGGITDFRSIRFMRMFMTGFESKTVFRFAQMELVRNQWRRYTQDLSNVGAGLDECEIDPVFEVDAVNIEENSERDPFNYVLPEGIQREQSLGVVNIQQNEQSVSVRVEGLCDGAEKGIFRNLDRDFRVYERIKMFVHAEEVDGLEVPDGALNLFLRFGSDFQNNYYEYELPLVMSDPDVIQSLQRNTSQYRREVWRIENEIDLELRQLVDIKTIRNQDASFSLNDEFVRAIDTSGTKLVKIKGNPNFGDVKVMMIGIRNPYDADGAAYSVEMWANELRLTGLDERGSVAATARLDVQLADFGNLTLAGNYSSIGFGAINQKVQERSRDQILGYDAALNLELGKFFPDKWGLRLPLFAQVSNVTKNPEFDPYDLDIRLKDKLRNAESQAQRDSIKQLAQEVVNIRTVNLTNVRKDRTNSTKKPMPWDIENFSASYSYTETERRDPLISLDEEKQHTGSLDYSFSRKVKYIEPLKGLKAPALKFFKEFNFNPLPNSFDFSTIVTRRFATTSYRFTDLDPRFTTFYTKRFNWDRDYNLQWDLAKSLKFNFNALVGAVIDEPDELQEDGSGVPFRISDEFRRDSIWNNIKQFGRIKNYRHNLSLSYNLPIRYLPLMDWVQVRANYTADYSWTAAPLNAEYLGNIIQNNQSRRITGDLNFERLYSQLPYLKKFASKRRRSRSNTRINRPTRGDAKATNEKSKKENEPSTIEKILIRPLLLVRKGRVNFDQSYSTIIPGFTPQPRFLGLSDGFDAPGWAFVAGIQPDIRTLQLDDPKRRDQSLGFLEQNSDWITSDVRLNQQVIQTFSERFDANLTLEPFNDFQVELEMNRDYQEDNTQYYKDVDKEDGVRSFVHGVPQTSGSVKMSFSALKTLLNSRGFGINEDYFAELFDRFNAYTVILSNRLGTGTHANEEEAQFGYTAGYGRVQQDILIPAFIAAYTEQDPNEAKLDVFDELPRVNWRLNYDGFSKLPGIRDIFSDFSITHSYRSSLSVNSFFTDLNWLGTGGTGLNTDGNFYPRITIPDVEFQEGFAPFIAVSANTQNGMAISADYNRTRKLSLNLDGKQISETQSKEIILGFGYLIENVDLGFLKGKRERKKDDSPVTADPNAPAGRNTDRQGKELDINFDFSLRDDITYNTPLNGGTQFIPTRGSYRLSFSPSAEYQMSRQLALRLFFDYQKDVPKATNGFPRTTLAGGVVVRFQLN